MIEYNDKNYVCHLDLGMGIIRGKWKAVIMCHLNKGPKRFLQLHRITAGISQKVLMNQLQELENEDLIIKEVVCEKPLHVEYRLSEKGVDLYPAIEILEVWAKKHYHHIKHVEEIK